MKAELFFLLLLSFVLEPVTKVAAVSVKQIHSVVPNSSENKAKSSEDKAGDSSGLSMTISRLESHSPAQGQEPPHPSFPTSNT